MKMLMNTIPAVRSRWSVHSGEPIVKGKHITRFTDGEEEEMHLAMVVRFLVGDGLLLLGAVFEKLASWRPFSVVDGRLISGQDPASSTSAPALKKVVKAQTAH